MDRLTIDQVQQLFERRPGSWCVSIYLPTHRSGKEIREDPIRLKNRVSEAKSQLEAAAVAGGEIKCLLEPAQILGDLDSESNREFWRHQAEGLAMFLEPESSQHFRLAQPCDELTVVAHRFHVKPLIRAVQQDGEYCVLAVSQNGVRLLEGSVQGLTERPMEELPESLQAVVRGDHHKGFGLHSFHVRPNAGDSAVPHGHVESDEEHELTRYFRIIDEALNDGWKHDQRPLVFAGVAELFPYFRKTTTYSNALEESVAGNPDDSSADELHRRAWPLIEGILEKRRQQLVERWQAARQSELGETSLKNIVVAAHDGRVETLLLDPHRQHWGTCDEGAREVQTASEATAHNYDLGDLAAIRTISADGRVVFIDDDQTLGRDGIAAIFRYAAS